MSDDGFRIACGEEFRAFLAEIGQTQHGFAKTMLRLGDDRAKGTVVRHIQRLASGEAGISGEMRVIMGIFRNSARKRRKAAAERGGEMTEAA